MRRGFATIMVLGLVAAILVFSGAYYLKQINKQLPVNTQPSPATNGYQQSPYASAEDCQNKTGKKCTRSLCQASMDMPLEEQKKYTETCVTGWVPEESLSTTANWKTFTNSNFSFSIKYPINWTIEEDTPIKPDIVIYSPDNSSNLIISPISESRYITVRNRDKKLANSAIILFAGRSSREYREDFSDKFQTVFVRDIQIEDINGLNWTKPNEISYEVDKSKPDLLTTFDQILSTFKFLD